jgi:DNA-binding NarL/FixJ family response regulator
MRKKAIGICDKDVLLSQGLASLFSLSEDFHVSFQTDCIRKIRHELHRHRTQMLLVALHPDCLCDLHLLAEIKQKCETIKIVICSQAFTQGQQLLIEEAGLDAMLPRSLTFLQLQEALLKVNNTLFFFIHPLVAEQIQHTRQEDEQLKFWKSVLLSVREKELLCLICADYSNKMIADKLHIDLDTVETHRKHLKAKTRCKTSAGLLNYAVAMGICAPKTLNK